MSHTSDWHYNVFQYPFCDLYQFQPDSMGSTRSMLVYVLSMGLNSTGYKAKRKKNPENQ